MEEITAFLKDVERFLTQVLGKVSNLPGDVNKERLELTEKLQKFLKLPEKDSSKRKPPPPLPSKPSPAEEEVDEGEYGDVAIHDDGGQETYDDVVKGDVGGEEMYDDVAHATEPPAEVEEEYDDVAALNKTETTDEPEEFYDDIDPGINTGISKRSSSKKSNSSEILDATGVGEPRRASDIKDKIYEGDLEKYKSKGLFKKFQRRYCVLTPLALYYYESKKDQKQKGQIILPLSESTLRKGCHSFPEVKDKKLCFELGNEERSFLFKVTKESELDIWMKHIMAALSTDLSDEQSRIMRQKSIKMSNHDEDEAEDEAEDLYECIDTMQQNKAAAEPEELYELTDQFSSETSGSSSVAPVLPARAPAGKSPAGKPPAGKPPAPQQQQVEEEEEFEKVDDDTEDFEIDSSAPAPAGKAKKEDEKPPPVDSRTKPSSSPTLPPRPSSTQDVPNLPPRATPGAKKAPPTLPTRTTPTLTKVSQPSPPESEPEPEAEAKTEPVPKPEVLPPVKAKPLKGEQFDYNKVYVAMWNCDADDDDDLAFSRGNYLYIREKIPNSDWWVASLMDIPDIRVGLVPRNYIMPAYDM